jgi:8-oxo-dGTP pyrophosphatase MutT (NUDIX family)
MMSSALVGARDQLRRYLDVYPDEAARFPLLSKQLESDALLFARSNMTGHVTSSAAVLNPPGTRILLIDHVVLKRWLVPGGHYEGGSLLESAMREVEEETGLTNAVPHPWLATHGIALDVDSHDIPPNPAKGEGAHVHHDFMYLLQAPEGAELTAQIVEVHAARWAPVQELLDSADRRVRLVHAKLLRVGAI